MPQRMEGVIERVRENKLDALYLFINETLRNRAEFDIFFHNLMNVLPNNWSINRVEIGHEFLSMISNLDELTVIAADGVEEGNEEGIIAEAAAAGNNPNPNQGQQGNDENEIEIENKQDSLFHWVCSLESLRSLIISDGYIPRKDHGFCDTKSLLRNLPLAKNLQYLDIQRLKLNTTETTTTQEGGRGGETTDDSTVSDSCEDAELLANSLESLTDSLEDIRITSITICEHKSKSKKSSSTTTTTTTTNNANATAQRYPLDAAIRVCGDMANLQLLAISCASGSGCNCGTHSGDNNENNNENNDDEDEDANGEQHQQQHQQQQQQDGGGDGNNGSSLSEDNNITKKQSSTCLVSNEVLLELCRTSTTLQELALRSMRIDDEMCKTIAEAFDPPNTNNHHRMIMPMPMAMSGGMQKVNSSNSNNNNLMLSTEDVRYGGDDIYDDDDASNTNTHSPSFWTSLDLRQNPNIGKIGYNAILASLERNYDLWCSLMVDNESFQSKFNALIELNQANRGTLIRSPSVDKLAVFIDRLNSTSSSSGGDPTSLWYFLNIHRNSILHPYVRYMKWKNMILRRRKEEKEASDAASAVITTSGQQHQQQQQQHHQTQPQQREYNLPPQQRQQGAASTTTTIGGSNTGSSSSTCSPSDQNSGLTILAVEQHNTTRTNNNEEEEDRQQQQQQQQQQPDLKRYKQSSD